MIRERVDTSQGEDSEPPEPRGRFQRFLDRSRQALENAGLSAAVY